jgi:hypothetical protein
VGHYDQTRNLFTQRFYRNSGWFSTQYWAYEAFERIVVSSSFISWISRRSIFQSLKTVDAFASSAMTRVDIYRQQQHLNRRHYNSSIMLDGKNQNNLFKMSNMLRPNEKPARDEAATDPTVASALKEGVGRIVVHRKSGTSKLLETQWYQQYKELVAFKEEHGHCLVPMNKKSLGKWASLQRNNNKNNTLRQDRTDLLEELGFVWNSRTANEDNQWFEKYARLIIFQQKRGHCAVPQVFKEDLALGHWVDTQRSSPPRPDRKALLEKLGFIWSERSWHDGNSSCDAHDQKWNQKYERLAEFHREHGHCVVPSSYKGDKTLWRWVRKHKYSLAIRPDRKVLLEKLGFAAKVNRWDKVFEQLEEFKRKHGHLNIQFNSNARNSGLAAWAKAQQQEAGAGLLKIARRKRLVDIGLLIDDEVQNETTVVQEQNDVCENKDKDPVELEECRVMAPEEQHQVVELNVAVAPKKQCLSSPQEALPPAMTSPLHPSAGFEYSVLFEPAGASPLGLGLEPITMGNGCRVVSIQHGSQSWQSGNIQLGDVVSKINGQALRHFCYGAITFLLHRQLRQEVTFCRPALLLLAAAPILSTKV